MFSCSTSGTMLLIYIILFLAVQKKKREAEAHETAIMLAKENDELKMKLKALIEDNSKLIELYEQAAAENNNRNVNKGEDGQEIGSKIDNGFCRVVFLSCFTGLLCIL